MFVFLKIILQMFLLVTCLEIKACTVTYSVVISNDYSIPEKLFIKPSRNAVTIRHF